MNDLEIIKIKKLKKRKDLVLLLSLELGVTALTAGTPVSVVSEEYTISAAGTTLQFALELSIFDVVVLMWLHQDSSFFFLSLNRLFLFRRCSRSMSWSLSAFL